MSKIRALAPNGAILELIVIFMSCLTNCLFDTEQASNVKVLCYLHTLLNKSPFPHRASFQRQVAKLSGFYWAPCIRSSHCFMCFMLFALHPSLSSILYNLDRLNTLHNFKSFSPIALCIKLHLLSLLVYFLTKSISFPLMKCFLSCLSPNVVIYT